jgi:cytochrome c553
MRPMKHGWLIAVLLSAAALTPALAEDAASKADPFTGGSAEAGAAKAASCVACHGPAGNSGSPDFPKLAGQSSVFTYRSLQALKSGHRQAPVMNPMAAPLSDQDMKDLAAYFAAQKGQPGVASPDAVKVAQPIYRAGDAQRGLPACSACHGPQGHGNAAAGYPRIGGQHAKYAAAMLRKYRMAGAPATGAQSGMPMDQPQTTVMAAVAAKLTDAEIDALASYINGLH